MKKKHFSLVFNSAESKYYKSSYFWTRYIISEPQIKSKPNRNNLGIIVNKKKGNAVKRNKFRRQLMNSLKFYNFPTGYFVFGISSSWENYQQLAKEVETFVRYIDEEISN